MAYDNELATPLERHALVFDIETVPMPGCEAYLDLAGISAPANYKDPEKIAAYIEAQKRKVVETAGLDLDLCEIACLGWERTDTDTGAVYLRSLTDEATMLRDFWRAVDASGLPLLGFNVLAFDLPVLLRRSLYLGVPTPTITIDRYRHERVIDLAETLSFGRRELLRSLSFYARRFGVPHDDTVTGADIARLVAAGDWAAVSRHCYDDVATTRRLAERLGLLTVARQVAATVV